MEHRTTAQAKALDQLHRQALYRVGDAEVQSALASLGTYLVDSEAQLIALMNKKEPPTEGEIEFGMVLYWIHHDLPDDTFFNWLASLFPPTRITATDINNWEETWQGPGAVATDGTLFGYGTFEQLDKGWLFSTVLYLISILTSDLPKAPFGTTPLQTPVGSGSTLRVAVLGDWGSGTWNDGGTQGPAAEIMAQINALSPPPDLVIHLGDVYYSGTGDLPFGVGLVLSLLGAKIGVPFDPGEENDRLLAPWWKGGRSGNSFTLNSNHEMYSAARGYFHNALGSALFAAQKNTSYFALEFQDWVILGLDSAYYSQSIAVMKGRLQDSKHAEQVAWVKGLNLSGKKVLALTHHTALTYDGLPMTNSNGAPTLADDMREALNGRDPDYWYWGHIHNGIVYTDAASPGTKSRCVGHAALPFGLAYYWENQTQHPLSDSPRVAYFSNTSKPNPQKNPRWDNRVLNGFALLTLGKGTITEEFYEQGNPDHVWCSPPV